MGGGSAGLHSALRSLCPGAPDYLLLELDPGLAAAKPRGVDAVVADARRPPLRRVEAVAVLHDSLHHIPGWRRVLHEMLEPYSCVVVSDYDPGTIPGRILSLLERLAGFPAEFTPPDELAALLEANAIPPP